MRRSVRIVLLAISVATVLLAGCARVNSDLYCPYVMPYTLEVQRRAADELDRLPADSEVRRMIEDYGELRARLREACGA